VSREVIFPDIQYKEHAAVRGLWRWYINITITILDIIHRPVFYLKLNWTLKGLSVPHRKHVTSPLRAQQVNAVYRFVTMVYYYNYHNSDHYPSSCLLFETQLNSKRFVRTS
jgi:hypothetical protein